MTHDGVVAQAPRCPACGKFMQLVDEISRFREYECCVTRSVPHQEQEFREAAEQAHHRRRMRS